MSMKSKMFIWAVLFAALLICLTCSDKSTGPPEVFAPEIASISPERGPVRTRVAIKGDHFGNEIGSILFGDRAPYVALWSDTLIQADAPSQIKEPCYIFVRTGDKKKDSVWFVVEYLQIESITPDHGLPGHEVTITGQNFGSTAGTVFFDSLEADIVSWSSTQIILVVPENATSCNVEVHSGNMVSNLHGFAIDKMTITQIIPNRAIPNTEIEIHGYKFGEQPGTIQFQDALGEVISWSDTLIVAKVPIGGTSGDVHVEVGGAPSNSISFNVEELYISHITPASAPYGEEIEIHGTFYGATEITVIYGDVEIEAEDFNDTLIVMTIPGEANSGNVTISANSLLSNSIYFYILPFDSFIDDLREHHGLDVFILGYHKFYTLDSNDSHYIEDTIQEYCEIKVDYIWNCLHWQGNSFFCDYREDIYDNWEPPSFPIGWYKVYFDGIVADFGESIIDLACSYTFYIRIPTEYETTFIQLGNLPFNSYVSEWPGGGYYYSFEGPGCEDIVDSLHYEYYIFPYPSGSGKTLKRYISTDWNNTEYPAKITARFWQ